MKTVKLSSIYDEPNIYNLLYNVESDVKHFEANCAARAVNQFAVTHEPKMLTQGISVTEPFAGSAPHFEYFLQHLHLPLKSYAVLDQSSEMLSGIWSKDRDNRLTSTRGSALTSSFSGKSDIVLNYFNAFATAVKDSEGNHTRKALKQYLVNVYTGIRTSIQLHNFKHGALYFDLRAQDNLDSLYRVGEDSELECEIPIFHPIRYKYKYDEISKLVLTGNLRRTYNRLTSTHYDHLSNLKLKCKSKPSIAFELSAPVTFRYWSESEVTDLLFEVGFTKIEYLRSSRSTDCSDNEHTTLDAIITEDNSPFRSDYDRPLKDSLTTNILAIV